jgi:hypothetical protein
MNDNGSNSADSAENSKPSSSGGRFNSANDARTLVGSSDVTIDDMISMHLVDCSQCREFAANSRPIPNIPRVGVTAKDGHCGTYWQLQLMRAKYEGSVNNIVAYTEHGDEAPKGANLE